MSQRPIHLAKLRAIQDQISDAPAQIPKKRKLRTIERGSKLSSGLLLGTMAILVAGMLLVAPAHTDHTQKTKKTASHKKPILVHSVTPIAPAPAGVTTLSPLNGGKHCAEGTVLTTVAHEDDDILFMNPDLANEISTGKCMRTIFVTAGDDGHGTEYWQKREQGALAAYAAMYNLPNGWSQGTATINDKPVVYDTLNGQPLVSLVFMHLPDGNLAGEGFASTGYQSLNKLRYNLIPNIGTIDGTASYSRQEIVAALGTIMQLDKPSIINTQSFGAVLSGEDHSDHQAVGYFTALARQTYSPQSALIRYYGYQIRGLADNLTPDQTAAKIATFNAYDQFDQYICMSAADCPGYETYADYTSRQYEQNTPVGNLSITPKQ